MPRNQIKLWHQLAIQYLGKKCVICGVTKKLHIHHIDRNPENNQTANLELLCTKHHRNKHYRIAPNQTTKISYNGDLPNLHCNRCNHDWIPRRQKLPKVCPSCKNPNWHKIV